MNTILRSYVYLFLQSLLPIGDADRAPDREYDPTANESDRKYRLPPHRSDREGSLLFPPQSSQVNFDRFTTVITCNRPGGFSGFIYLLIEGLQIS